MGERDDPIGGKRVPHLGMAGAFVMGAVESLGGVGRQSLAWHRPSPRHRRLQGV